MKKPITLLIFIYFIGILQSATAVERWTDQEMKIANTAAQADYLNTEEKSAIMYLNLARLYPKKYVSVEINPYSRKDAYESSLIAHLNRIRPMGPLLPDETLKNLALCLAKEQEISGEIGHTRHNCERIHAECCQYGQSTGRSVILALLIDRGVPSYGHRKIILTQSYRKVGAALADHPVYREVMVLDFQ